MVPLRGAVPIALATRFGGRCRPEFATPAVDTVVQQIMPANMDRLSLSFSNFGGGDVIISPNPNMTATHGILLRALVGFASFDVYQDTVLPAWEWFAISPGGAGTLSVTSVVREVEHVEVK